MIPRIEAMKAVEKLDQVEKIDLASFLLSDIVSEEYITDEEEEKIAELSIELNKIFLKINDRYEDASL